MTRGDKSTPMTPITLYATLTFIALAYLAILLFTISVILRFFSTLRFFLDFRDPQHPDKDSL